MRWFRAEQEVENQLAERILLLHGHEDHASVASPGSVRPLPPRRPLRAPRRPRRPVVDRARPARRVEPWPATPATAPELFGTAPFAAPGDPQNSVVLFRTRNLSILQATTCVRRCCTSLSCARALKLFYSNLTSSPPASNRKPHLACYIGRVVHPPERPKPTGRQPRHRVHRHDHHIR
eukprot:SAG11_NODE_735_length_7452_cov_26.426629_11_plen_178_part_00